MVCAHRHADHSGVSYQCCAFLGMALHQAQTRGIAPACPASRRGCCLTAARRKTFCRGRPQTRNPIRKDESLPASRQNLQVLARSHSPILAGDTQRMRLTPKYRSDPQPLSFTTCRTCERRQRRSLSLSTRRSNSGAVWPQAGSLPFHFQFGSRPASVGALGVKAQFMKSSVSSAARSTIQSNQMDRDTTIVPA